MYRPGRCTDRDRQEGILYGAAVYHPRGRSTAMKKATAHVAREAKTSFVPLNKDHVPQSAYLAPLRTNREQSTKAKALLDDTSMSGREVYRRDQSSEPRLA